MEIQTKYFAALREIVGKKIETMQFDEGAQVQEVIKKMITAYGKPLEAQLFDERGRLSASYQILINGINIGTLEGLATPLKEGDTIAILPPVGGGA